MLTVVIALGAVAGVALLASLLVVIFVAWLARASERAYRTPPGPEPDRCTMLDEENPAAIAEYRRLCEEGARN